MVSEALKRKAMVCEGQELLVLIHSAVQHTGLVVILREYNSRTLTSFHATTDTERHALRQPSLHPPSFRRGFPI